MKISIDKIINSSVGVLVPLIFATAIAGGAIYVVDKFNLVDEKYSYWIPPLSYFFVLLLIFLLKSLSQSRLIKSLRKIVRKIFYAIVTFFREPPFIVVKYTAEERSEGRYHKAIEEQIKNSTRIYIRLVSGHTMYYDGRESFVLNLLKDMSKNEVDKKDIKIQLLDRSNVSFEERAQRFVELMDKQQAKYRCSYKEYLKRCEEIEDNLEEIIGKNSISFYKRKYLWRLHIFDDVIFISSYSDGPEMIEGHLSSAYSFNRECDASLFDGFLEEFNSLYKKSNLHSA